MKNRNLATANEAPAMPPKPRIAATKPSTKNRSARRSIAVTDHLLQFGNALRREAFLVALAREFWLAQVGHVDLITAPLEQRGQTVRPAEMARSDGDEIGV
jgi:hypothetical protein